MASKETRGELQGTPLKSGTLACTKLLPKTVTITLPVVGIEPLTEVISGAGVFTTKRTGTWMEARGETVSIVPALIDK